MCDGLPDNNTSYQTLDEEKEPSISKEKEMTVPESRAVRETCLSQAWVQIPPSQRVFSTTLFLRNTARLGQDGCKGHTIHKSMSVWSVPTISLSVFLLGEFESQMDFILRDQATAWSSHTAPRSAMPLGRQSNFSRAEQEPGHGVSSGGLHRKGGNIQLTLLPGSRLEKALKR